METSVCKKNYQIFSSKIDLIWWRNETEAIKEKKKYKIEKAINRVMK